MEILKLAVVDPYLIHSVSSKEAVCPDKNS